MTSKFAMYTGYQTELWQRSRHLSVTTTRRRQGLHIRNYCGKHFVKRLFAIPRMRWELYIRWISGDRLWILEWTDGIVSDWAPFHQRCLDIGVPQPDSQTWGVSVMRARSACIDRPLCGAYGSREVPANAASYS